jgi:hypothetical protein
MGIPHFPTMMDPQVCQIILMKWTVRLLLTIYKTNENKKHTAKINKQDTPKRNNNFKANMFFFALCDPHCGIYLDIYSDIILAGKEPGILSDIYSDILSDF